MPLNGKSTPIAKPSWLKDTSPAQPSTATTTTPTRPWARKLSEAKKEEEPAKKEVSAKLQSREIKVPLKVEKTAKAPSILKKPEAKPEPVRESKTPSKSPSKTPSSISSKSPSTTPSKSTSTTPSKSPSKTPDYETDSDEESSDESETDSSEETESDEDYDSDEKPSYKPPSPGALKKHLIIPPLKKVVTKSPEKSEPERSQSPEYTFKKPELKKVITKQKSETKERSTSPEPKFFKAKLRKVPSSLKAPILKEKLPVVELKKAPSRAEPEKSARKMSEQFPHKPSLLRAESSMKSE